MGRRDVYGVNSGLGAAVMLQSSGSILGGDTAHLYDSRSNWERICVWVGVFVCLNALKQSNTVD